MRDRFANRRGATIASIPWKHGTLHVGFGQFADGRLGEIFAAGGKPGSETRIAVLEAITAASFALQHGATPEEILRALPHDGPTPEGALGLILQAWLDLCRPNTTTADSSAGE